MRATTSVGPPAAKGIIIRKLPVGKSAALSAPAAKTNDTDSNAPRVADLILMAILTLMAERFSDARLNARKLIAKTDRKPPVNADGRFTISKVKSRFCGQILSNSRPVTVQAPRPVRSMPLSRDCMVRLDRPPAN